MNRGDGFAKNLQLILSVWIVALQAVPAAVGHRETIHESPRRDPAPHLCLHLPSARHQMPAQEIFYEFTG